MRDAACAGGFRYSLRDPGGYYGFPLIHLHTILGRREIPYRPSFSALEQLEALRPRFFTLADLQQNRPAPNYLLHESAHAVAFQALFGRPASVVEAFSQPGSLIKLMLGEAFAMTAEYFAACAVEGQPHAWLFSISSYRHRTQKKRALGRAIEQHGFELVAHALLLAFLCHNFLIERLDAPRLSRLLALADERGAARLSVAARRELGGALSGAMQMSPAFRYHTSRLFLSMFGRSRNIRRELRADPLELLARDAELLRRSRALVARLGGASGAAR